MIRYLHTRAHTASTSDGDKHKYTTQTQHERENQSAQCGWRVASGGDAGEH